MIKVGFIGTGNIATFHIENLLKFKEVKIVSVCDKNEKNLRKAVLKTSAKPYTLWKEMIRKEKIDCCFICVPPFAHEDMEEVIAKRGIHIFVEKPLGLDIEKVREKEQIIKKSGIITCAGYVLRYIDIFEKTKKLFEKEKIILLNGKYYSSTVPSSWWAKKELSGGQVIEQTTHIFDTARYIAGEVSEVYAAGFKEKRKDKNYNIEDASIATLIFKSGAIGVVTSTCIFQEWLPEVEFISKNIYVKIVKFSDLKIARGKNIEYQTSKTDGLFTEDRVFIDAILKNNRNLIKSDYSDALKTLELTLAVQESIETGKKIKL